MKLKEKVKMWLDVLKLNPTPFVVYSDFFLNILRSFNLKINNLLDNETERKC
jgi:hypothetical protein